MTQSQKLRKWHFTLWKLELERPETKSIAPVKRSVRFPRPEDLHSFTTPELRDGSSSRTCSHPAKSAPSTPLSTAWHSAAQSPPNPFRYGIAEFGTRYFTERRELGILNIGPPGAVRVDTTEYALDSLDCLYIGKGEEDIVFLPTGPCPPVFYFLSCPAHQAYPTQKIARDHARHEPIGQALSASKQTIHKYIHPGSAQSCQFVMGLTELEPGSVWNTMPPHTHSRRTEIYLYFNMGEGIAVHLMGPPQSTRSLIVRDREAVLSPDWSIHCAAGTSSYAFIWGMAGENQDFSDMDPVSLKDLMWQH